MRIGELAERTGLTHSRIRFYERIGLLTAAERRANGYRAYGPDAVRMLELIATAQTAGFSLDEIRALLPSNQRGWRHDRLLATLRHKVAELEALEARLARSRAQLAGLIADIGAKPDDMDCAANARRVLANLTLQADGGPEPDKAGRDRTGGALQKLAVPTTGATTQKRMPGLRTPGGNPSEPPKRRLSAHHGKADQGVS